MKIVRTRAIPFLLTALLFWCCGGGGERTDTALTNVPVVLLTVDGLVAEQFSALGGEHETAAFDSLIEEGLVWPDAWTACPMTRPAVTSYLTGLAPDRHGVTDDLTTSLSAQIPTLASLLSDQGYATAAFPAASFFHGDDALLGGFSLVDEVPVPQVGPARWLPGSSAAGENARHFSMWAETLPAGAAYFAWIHISEPLQVQLRGVARDTARENRGTVKDETKSDAETEANEEEEGDVKETPAERGAKALDGALANVLSTLRARGEFERALIIVAGTMGDVTGGDDRVPGAGLSVDEAALRIPVLARFPSGVSAQRGSDEPVWALDVPATIAELTGIELAEGVEGESLLRPAAADRVLVAMSWAPLEQMGWLPLRAARLGSWRRVEGIEPRSFRENDESRPGEDDPDTQARLIDALAARAQVTPARVNLEEVRPWLESQGLQAQPVAAAGRAFGTLEQRREVARLVILGRIRTRTQAFRQANALMVRALKVDAQNYAVLLHRGQLLTFMEAKKAGEATRETVRLYPDRFDALHWLAHADWTEGWAEAEKLLTAILPYRPNDMDVLYDIACARSLAGDLPAAEEHLRAAIEAGYRQWNSIEIDPDLRNLRETPRYAELLREYGR